MPQADEGELPEEVFGHHEIYARIRHCLRRINVIGKLLQQLDVAHKLRPKRRKKTKKWNVSFSTYTPEIHNKDSLRRLRVDGEEVQESN